MSDDLSLRERLASYNIHDPVAGAVEQAILEWLCDNGLALVPVSPTVMMQGRGRYAVAETADAGSFEIMALSAYRDMVSCAPPAAELLGTKEKA